MSIESYGTVAIWDAEVPDIEFRNIFLSARTIREILEETLGKRPYRKTTARMKIWEFGRVYYVNFNVWHTTHVLPDDLVTGRDNHYQPMFHGRLVIAPAGRAIRGLTEKNIDQLRSNLYPMKSEDGMKALFYLMFQI